MSEFAYAAWRFAMWTKGYGSYIEIEKAVEDGLLVPCKKYPYKETENKPDRVEEEQ